MSISKEQPPPESVTCTLTEVTSLENPQNFTNVCLIDLKKVTAVNIVNVVSIPRPKQLPDIREIELIQIGTVITAESAEQISINPEEMTKEIVTVKEEKDEEKPTETQQTSSNSDESSLQIVKTSCRYPGRKRRKKCCYTIDKEKKDTSVHLKPSCGYAGRSSIGKEWHNICLGKKTCSLLNGVRTYGDIELACAFGISSDEMTPGLIAERKESINEKLKEGDLCFTREEEYDIHQRAETHCTTIRPHSDYCLVTKAGRTTQHPGIHAHNHRSRGLPGGRKRKRHLPTMADYVVPSAYAKLYPELTHCVTLTDGTQLLKPSSKLVELVAQVINDSPDCMLQVQQVYTILQKKFPFFQYLDRSSTTSWRSSIRHALYQKWFSKVKFSSELICCKGCYWALNRGQKPKEWKLPPPATQTNETEGEKDGAVSRKKTSQKVVSDSILTQTLEQGHSDDTDDSHQPLPDIPSDTSDGEEEEDNFMDEIFPLASTPEPPCDGRYSGFTCSRWCKDPDPILNTVSMSQNSDTNELLVPQQPHMGSFGWTSPLSSLSGYDVDVELWTSDSDSGYSGPAVDDISPRDEAIIDSLGSLCGEDEWKELELYTGVTPKNSPKSSFSWRPGGFHSTPVSNTTSKPPSPINICPSIFASPFTLSYVALPLEEVIASPDSQASPTKDSTAYEEHW